MSETRICRDCSEEYFITQGERAFYEETKGWPLPLRCRECRRLRKAERGEISAPTSTWRPTGGR